MIRASAIPKVSQSLLALIAGVALCQCALPPGSAWTVIRKDGFKNYLAISWGKKPVPEYVKEMLPEAFGRAPEVMSSADELANPAADPQIVKGEEAFPPLPSEMPEDWKRGAEPAFPLMSTEPPEFPSLTPPVAVSDTTSNAKLMPVPPLPESAPDVDEFAKVSIPEFLILPDQFGNPPTVGITQKPAPGLKMKDPAANPSANLAQGLLGLKKTAIKTVPVAKTAAEQQVTAAEKAMPETKIHEPTPAAEATPKDGSVDKGGMGGREAAESTVGLPKGPLPPALDGMPFGKVVPGRPGYVRSPFAKDHQVVDVMGVKGGDVVKCPYSGKLFRVPVGQEVKNRVPAVGKEENESDPNSETRSAEKSKETPGKPK